jgi:CheY-like chemotaxis protein
MILIVEDDEAVQDVMKKAIESAGVEVLIAENGQVALDLLKDNWPDMILLDLMMPVMDGFEFINHFRELEDAENVPVIVVTAKDLTAQERDQLNHKVEGIYGKQENYIEDVVNNVGQLIDSHADVVIKNDET